MPSFQVCFVILTLFYLGSCFVSYFFSNIGNTYTPTKMTKTITLHYFNVKGRAEPIRYLLAYKKVDYTDHRFAREEWPQLKAKMPNGQVPVLEVDGKYLTQTIAILTYLGEENGLVGKSSWDRAKLEEVSGTVTDLQILTMKWHLEKDVDKKEQMADELRTTTLPQRLSNLERIAQLDQGNKFILGDNPTWADFALAGFLERQNDSLFHGKLEQTSKVLADFLKRMQSLPGIQEYIAKRPQTDM